MNATTLNELRAGQRGMTDEKMDQVRDLLFGEYQRESEARIALLEERMRELELSLHRRLDALQARLDALAGEIDTGQRSAYDEIGRGLQELSERIRRLSRA